MTSAAPANDVARRRAAIAAGLAAQLSPQQAQRGLQLWDSGYSGARATAVIEFVMELAALLDLPPKKRHEVRMGLYQSLLGKDATTPASTPSAAEPAAPGASPELANTAPMFAVFRCVCESLVGSVRDDGDAALADFVALLQRERQPPLMSPEDRACMVRWIRGVATLGACAQHSEAALARTLHALYVAAAEALGPVAADRMLAHAVTMAETLPEARRFAPRRFL